MHATTLFGIFIELTSISVVVANLTASSKEAAFKIEYSPSQAQSATKQTQSTFLYGGAGSVAGDLTSEAAKKGTTDFILSSELTESSDTNKLYIKSATQGLLEIGTASGEAQKMIYNANLDINYLRWKVSADNVLQPFMNRPDDFRLIYHCGTHFEIHGSQGTAPAPNCQEVTFYARYVTK